MDPRHGGPFSQLTCDGQDWSQASHVNKAGHCVPVTLGSGDALDEGFGFSDGWLVVGWKGVGFRGTFTAAYNLLDCGENKCY